MRTDLVWEIVNYMASLFLKFMWLTLSFIFVFLSPYSKKQNAKKAYRMQNIIPTLYILELESSVVKSAKILTILCPFVQNFFKKH